MTPEKRIAITPHHRNRVALTYVRNATLAQDPEGLARLAYQQGQSGHAWAWGWPERLIQVIDEDLGTSGANPDRSGFRRMCQLIAAGEVGLVLVSDLSRLSRSVAELRDFLRLCHTRETLVAVDGNLVDPSTLYLRESSPRQVRKNAGSALTQRDVRELFRQVAEGKSVAEIADEFYLRKVETTHKGTGQ